MASKRSTALEAMIEEATVDTDGHEDERAGLFTMIEEHLAVPFTTTVLGVEVTVGKVELAADSIVAVCARGRHRHESAFSTCRYPPLCRTVPRGSTPTGTGPEGRPR
ncbi:hypothetical protein O7628_15945 [Micromonospora sp. WMMD956]|nr:hypothetical protein [Micromonospora sp. WMMD956]MDG4816988.1 hypothetical protein [Micromonospora sp. WMMD956]